MTPGQETLITNNERTPVDKLPGTEFLPAHASFDKETRHPATTQVLRWFEADHLPPGPVRELSLVIGNYARYLAAVLPDGPELTTGLRKLLEAKDCLVRAAIDAREGESVLYPITM